MLAGESERVQESGLGVGGGGFGVGVLVLVGVGGLQEASTGHFTDPLQLLLPSQRKQ